MRSSGLTAASAALLVAALLAAPASATFFGNSEEEPQSNEIPELEQPKKAAAPPPMDVMPEENDEPEMPMMDDDMGGSGTGMGGGMSPMEEDQAPMMDPMMDEPMMMDPMMDPMMEDPMSGTVPEMNEVLLSSRYEGLLNVSFRILCRRHPPLRRLLPADLSVTSWRTLATWLAPESGSSPGWWRPSSGSELASRRRLPSSDPGSSRLPPELVRTTKTFLFMVHIRTQISLGSRLARPLVRHANRVASPFRTLAENIGRPVADAVDLEGFNEAIKPLREATEPLNRAFDPLRDAIESGLGQVARDNQIDGEELQKDIEKLAGVCVLEFIVVLARCPKIILSLIFRPHPSSSIPQRMPCWPR